MKQCEARGAGLAAILVFAIAAPACADMHGGGAAEEMREARDTAKHADMSGWNQEAAMAAAGDLAKALDGLRTALRKAPPPSVVPGAGSTRLHRLRDRIRLMESESKHLLSELGQGRGRDETLPIFERINEIRRGAVDDAQRTFLQASIVAQIEAARAPLETLAGFYGVKLDHRLEQR